MARMLMPGGLSYVTIPQGDTFVREEGDQRKGIEGEFEAPDNPLVLHQLRQKGCVDVTPLPPHGRVRDQVAVPQEAVPEATANADDTRPVKGGAGGGGKAG